MITPRSLFQKVNKEDAAKLATVVNETWFQKAITYTLADLSSRGLSNEQLNGANTFVESLTTLADEVKEPAQMPDKSQLKSYNR